MNFDELQKQWDNQSSEGVKIKKDFDQLKSASNILEDLRKKIKAELWVVVFSIIFILVVPYISLYKINGISVFFYYFFSFYLLLGSIINYVRFYHFYKISKDFELNSSKEMLLKVYYELKYALDTYLVTTIVATPSGIGLYFIIFSFGNSEKFFNQIIHISETIKTNPNFILWMIALVIGSIVIIGVILYYMYVKYYGTKLTQIKQILDQLEE
ncbi:hypothetical protein [Empedobacter brevis]|uniref:hypothetical protein n=1 Tax=Empedobacter brevis TaxID=247 RepID=UPI002897674C|nr:hypothetical protein [Empedobacter brevis]